MLKETPTGMPFSGKLCLLASLVLLTIGGIQGASGRAAKGRPPRSPTGQGRSPALPRAAMPTESAEGICGKSANGTLSPVGKPRL